MGGTVLRRQILRGLESAARRTTPRGPALALTIAVGILPLVGCFGTPRAGDEVAEAPEADSLWELAEIARVSGRHDEAATLYATFHRYHYRDDRAAEALLDAGTEFRNAGSIDKARDHLVTAAQRGDARIAPHAWMQIGYLERAEGNFAAAAMRFDDAARTALDPETRAEALLEQGISLQRAGAFSEARRPLTECAKLETSAPRHAAEARVALRQPPHFTVQVGVFQDRERAQALALQLSGSKIVTRVLEETVEGILLHRVVSGQYTRRPEAEAQARKIKFLGHEALIKP